MFFFFFFCQELEKIIPLIRIATLNVD